MIAAINGVVAGAGVSLALGCDLRVAADTATFSTAFVRIGLIPDAGSCYFLPRTLGTAKALELALLSDKVDAATALQIGLVTRVAPETELMAESMALAERLAAMPTRAIALTKGFLVAGFFMHLLTEKKLIYAVLALTVVFFAFLIWLPLHDIADKMGK